MQPPQAGRTTHRHLSAGQSVHSGGGMGVVVGGTGSAYLGGGMPADMTADHGGSGSRRRLMPQVPAYHQAYSPHMINYNPYHHYYPGILPPSSPYPNGVPAPPFLYMPPYSRQPSQSQFVHMTGATVSGAYNRTSPALATSYQSPPHVSQSIHSHILTQPAQPPPLTLSSQTPQSKPASPYALPLYENAVLRQSNFVAPLPWLSHPDEPFPRRALKSRRRRKPLQADSPVSIPVEPQLETAGYSKNCDESEDSIGESTADDAVKEAAAEDIVSQVASKEGLHNVILHSIPTAVTSERSSIETADGPPTPMTTQSRAASVSNVGSQSPSIHNHQQSEAGSPVVAKPLYISDCPTAKTEAPPPFPRPLVRIPVPSVSPIVPALPKTVSKDARPLTVEKSIAAGKAGLGAPHNHTSSIGEDDRISISLSSTDVAKTDIKLVDGKQAEASVTEEKLVGEKAQPAVKTTPKSWASLLTGPVFPKPSPGNNLGGTGHSGPSVVAIEVDESHAGPIAGVVSLRHTSGSLAEALQSYRVGSGEKLAFIEPRGLINTGNMCYMNSILQVLIFCVPFYDFLDQVSKHVAHSFKNETPLLDAMVMFLREFKVIDAASSADQLRRRLKREELEKYGEPFSPDFVYEVVRKMPRFANMRRGHQQDAEEYLGFLLQSLDGECTQAMGLASTATGAEGLSSSLKDGHNSEGSDWREVGPRQRTAVTRSSGSNSTSPIGAIFGGFLRSELRVPGLKDSITTEPYQPLQLDIGSPKVRNILDALKGLTTIETIPGNFGSPRGKDVVATKQVFIESLPTVLILHLKRFQFDAEGNGTVKVWKKIGYPLDLEIPLQVLARQKRNQIVSQDTGLPKYKLTAVVYHHGKNASGGHYTADVRRQDGREWIRLDDTAIRRISSEDVAEAGAEEEHPKEARRETASHAAALKWSGTASDDDGGDDNGWKQVNSSVNNGKRWSSANNVAVPNPPTARSKHARESSRDNKVAYILFYQRSLDG